ILNGDAPDHLALGDDGDIGAAGEVIAAADHVAVRSKQDILSDYRLLSRLNKALHGDIGAAADRKDPALAAQDRTPADDDITVDFDPAVVPFGIQDGIVVDDDVVSDRDFVWVADGDRSAEHHITADFVEQQGKKEFAQEETQRPR